MRTRSGAWSAAWLSLTDVAAAGGWKDTQTLQRCYQHADPETLEAVLLKGRRFRRNVDRN